MKKLFLILMLFVTVLASGQNLQITGQMHDVTTYGGFDGWGEVTALHGTPPYTYHWNTGANTAIVHNLPAGSYAVMVSDAAGQRAFGDGSVMQVGSPPRSNGIMVDILNGIVYDATTQTKEVHVDKAGVLSPLPDSLFRDAKKFLNGGTSGKLDMRKTTTILVKYVKKQRTP